MTQTSWWKAGAASSGALAAIMTVSSAVMGAQAADDPVAVAGAAIGGAAALLWWTVAAGIFHRRTWGLHLGGAVAVLTLLQGLAALAQPGLASRTLEEQGLALQESVSTAALSWTPVLCSIVVLVSLLMIRRLRALHA